MKLYLHQQKLLTQNPKRHLLSWSCGTGKTFTALSLAHKNNATVLIIVPKALKENWKRTIDLLEFSVTYQLVSKEEFKRDYNILPPYNALILDEFHYFSGQKSQMSKNLTKYIKKHNPEYIWGLTATPYLSTPWNIYVLASHLGYPLNYWSFKQKFFYEIKMGHRMIPKIKPGSEVELAKIVQTIGSTVRLEDCADIPEQTYEVEYFNLNAQQRKAIKDLEDPVQISRWTKIHQIMGGTLKGDEYTPAQFFGSDKLLRLKELITENPQSIVVCRYKSEIEYLKEQLRDQIPIHIITGDVKNRDEVIQDCRKRDRYCLLVIAQCSEGWELPECPLMIFYSYDFSLKNFVQICGRILRINALKKNVFISLVVRDSIDEDVYKCVQNKMDFQIEIYKV